MKSFLFFLWCNKIILAADDECPCLYPFEGFADIMGLCAYGQPDHGIHKVLIAEHSVSKQLLSVFHPFSVFIVELGRIDHRDGRQVVVHGVVTAEVPGITDILQPWTCPVCGIEEHESFHHFFILRDEIQRHFPAVRNAENIHLLIPQFVDQGFQNLHLEILSVRLSDLVRLSLIKKIKENEPVLMTEGFFEDRPAFCGHHDAVQEDERFSLSMGLVVYFFSVIVEICHSPSYLL